MREHGTKNKNVGVRSSAGGITGMCMVNASMMINRQTDLTLS